jgi:hypothetical protein
MYGRESFLKNSSQDKQDVMISDFDHEASYLPYISLQHTPTKKQQIMQYHHRSISS